MRVSCTRAALWLAVMTAGLGAAPGAAFAREQDPAGPSPGTRQRVLRSWVGTERVHGDDVLRRKEIIFDYSAGVAEERTYDSNGQHLSSRTIVNGQPRPSAAEIAEAFAVIQADPKLGRLVSRVQAEPVGGFILEEARGEACGPRTRCLQISLVAKNGLGTLRWVVVDLTKQAIVYDNYGSLERERLLRQFRGVKR